MSALRGWKSHNPAHAIQQVTAKLKFTQPVTDIPWRKINDATRATAHKMGLIAEQPIQDINFAMMSGGMEGGFSPVGIEFLRLERPDFYSEKIAILRDEVSVEEWRYTRWAAFSEKLNALMLPIVTHFAQTVPVLSVQLEYIDLFQSKTPGEATDISEILRHPNNFIPSESFSQDQTFHSHTGYFQRKDDITKRLVNVDVDVVDVRTPVQPKALRSVRIRTNISDFFNQEGYTAISDEAFNTEFIASRLYDQHIELKDLLSSILSEEATDAISLKG